MAAPTWRNAPPTFAYNGRRSDPVHLTAPIGLHLLFMVPNDIEEASDIPVLNGQIVISFGKTQAGTDHNSSCLMTSIKLEQHDHLALDYL